jgi:hypothetical protein
MCATVCPSQALFFGTREQVEQLRPLSTPVNRFQFGRQTISTRVFMMMPAGVVTRHPYVDVTAAMSEQPRERAIRLTPAFAEASAGKPVFADASASQPVDADPFAGVEV